MKLIYLLSVVTMFGKSGGFSHGTTSFKKNAFAKGNKGTSVSSKNNANQVTEQVSAASAKKKLFELESFNINFSPVWFFSKQWSDQSPGMVISLDQLFPQFVVSLNLPIFLNPYLRFGFSERNMHSSFSDTVFFTIYNEQDLAQKNENEKKHESIYSIVGLDKFVFNFGINHGKFSAKAGLNFDSARDVFFNSMQTSFNSREDFLMFPIAAKLGFEVGYKFGGSHLLSLAAGSFVVADSILVPETKLLKIVNFNPNRDFRDKIRLVIPSIRYDYVGSDNIKFFIDGRINNLPKKVSLGDSQKTMPSLEAGVLLKKQLGDFKLQFLLSYNYASFSLYETSARILPDKGKLHTKINVLYRQMFELYLGAKVMTTNKVEIFHSRTTTTEIVEHQINTKQKFLDLTGGVCVSNMFNNFLRHLYLKAEFQNFTIFSTQDDGSSTVPYGIFKFSFGIKLPA